MSQPHEVRDNRVKVLLVDDHTILREGIRSLLSLEPDIEVVGEARDGLEAVEQVPRVKPDVVIMDMVMPRMNGLEATRQIKKRFPDVRILILSMYDDDEYVLQIIQAGASGYVLKRVATEELVNAIREVYKGSSFLYPPIAAKLIDDYVRRVKGADAGEPTRRHRTGTRGPCSPRPHQQRDRGDPVREQEDGREPLRQHHGKLDLHDVTELVKYALRRGSSSSTDTPSRPAGEAGLPRRG
jgi:DNA-binding NarL/FixJ family response regulator